VSPIFAERFSGKKGFIANSERELRHYLSLVKKYQIDVMIQEIVQGPVESLFGISGYFNKDSKPIIIFAGHVLRVPSLFNNPSATESIPISEVSEIKDTTVKYLTSINYCGIFNAAYKRDSRDKVFKFIEVNARSWWFNTFPSACGVNIILTAYLEAIGKEVESTEKYESGIYNIYLLRDLVTILSKDADLDQRFQFRKQLPSYMGRKHWSDYARDDPKPFLISLSNLLTARKKE
jgi:predicted ATP-grasp superfamily ATP-dependent carboligase